LALVREIMSKDCVTVTPQDTIINAAMKMRDLDIGFIPVVEGKKLAGVITDRDIVIRCVAEKKPDTTKVGEVLSQNLVTVSPDTTVDEAAKINGPRTSAPPACRRTWRTGRCRGLGRPGCA